MCIKLVMLLTVFTLINANSLSQTLIFSVSSAYIIDKNDKWTKEFAVSYLRLAALFSEIVLR